MGSMYIATGTVEIAWANTVLYATLLNSKTVLQMKVSAHLSAASDEELFVGTYVIDE